MATRPKATDSTEVQRLRKSLAREKEKRVEVEKLLVQEREQQAASAEILALIRRSPTDLRPVFDAIARHALALCGSVQANVFGFDGQLLHFLASENTRAEQVDLIRSAYPKKPDASTAAGRAVLARKVVRVEDALSDRAYDQRMAVAGGWRRVLAVPMIGDGVALGAIAVAWPDSGPIPRAQERLLKIFADQAVIAIENVRRFNETKEALERQTATAEILKVISSSPTDVRPVFEAIARSAVAICGSLGANVFRYDGDQLHFVSGYNTLGEQAALMATKFPMRPDRSQVAGRVVLSKSVIRIEDALSDAEYDKRFAVVGGWRKVLGVPLLREGQPIGAIVVRWAEAGPIAKQQEELLHTFADQAAIAIENVRLFNETKEALEQQTAISEVLRVISSSPADVQPVLEAVAARAAKICDASDARIALVEGDHIRHAAGFGDLPPTREHIPLDRGAPIGRAVIDRATVYITDIQAETGDDFALAREIAAKSGWRSNLVVPLMRKDAAVGAIALRRRDVRPFTPKQISLLQTFADQAAIAIENVRLFNETKEALEQQTATAEILKVISGSPTEVQPVFDAIAQSAVLLCGAMFGAVFRYDGELVHFTAHHGFSREALELIQSQFPRLPRGFMRAAIVDRAIVNSPDVLADPRLANLELAQILGHRSVLAVPMLREGQPIGGVIVFRKEIGPFADAHVNLLTTFADQAVIAIENVRLFNETKEALEQQTAISEVLRVISSSPADVQPILEAVASRAARICDATDARIFLAEGDCIRHAAGFGDLPVVVENLPLTRGSAIARAILDRSSVYIADITAEAGEEWAISREIAAKSGWRCNLAVPLMRENRALGAISLRRREVRPFSDKQISLLKTFADQAAIAIENVRLFNETKEALEHQRASSEILGILSRSPTDISPVMAALAESAARLCEATDAHVWQREGDDMRAVASHGALPLRRTRLRIGRDSVVGRAAQNREPVHVHDLAAVWEKEFPDANAMAGGGYRTVLAVPLVREGISIGAILIRRTEVKPFAPKQLMLLQTFADQAVIAIENVRLFNETKEALERQTATAEVLQVLSGSPSSLEPVFEAILGNASRLCNSHLAILNLYQDGKFRTAAQFGGNPEFVKWVLERGAFHPSESMTLLRMIETRQPVQAEDLKQSEAYRAGKGQTVHMVNIGGARTFLAVPLFKEGDLLGNIGIYRPEVLPFTDKQVDLVRSFANQAVIAIENVRLFNETREALERQIATADILKVIGSSPTDTQPVFEAIVQGGLKLFPNATIGVTRPNGARLEMVAIGHRDPAIAEATRTRFPIPLTRDYLNSRAILDARMIDLPDAELEKDGPFAPGIRNFLATGNRAMTVMPMLRGDEAIGTIGVTRATPGPLTDKQLSLLRIFADQAVIAIENVRLFNETKEALERQTATAEILKVIASSPSSVQPVFDAILENATRLCEAELGGLYLAQDEIWSMVSFRGEDPSVQQLFRDIRPGPLTGLGRMRQAGKPVHIPDLRADAATEQRDPVRMATLDRLGARTFLAVPLIKDGAILGAVVIYRREVRPFADTQIRLVRTFADQAVIAIENVRLFQALEARTNALTRSVSQLTALGEVGQAISSTLDLEKVLKTIAAHAVQLTGLDVATIYEFDEATGEFELRAWQNMPQDLIAVYREMPLRIGEGVIGKAAALREPVQVPDIHDPGYQTRYRDLLIRQGYRAILAVPMLREGRIVGAITVSRSKPGEFPSEVVELLKTFATQSALAIQNARLFREIADKSRQLEEASKHKSQFLASMSHELRTPLNALLGFNEMLLGEVYGPISQDMQPPLTQMQTSGKHLLRLINNVLDLAKIEAGRMELALSDYSVHDTVESVRATLRPLAEAKGLDFLVEMPADLPLAHGDSGRITQCLMNLAGNSLKFTKEGKVAIHVDQRDGLLVYRVSDTGIGIPPDKIDNLFTEFKQTDATIASEYGGTGLGLSISKKFVEMHGGRIWVESEPGQGSTFIFEIPLRAGEGKGA